MNAILACFAAIAALLAGVAHAATPAEHYKQWCAVCHDQPPDAKTPHVDAIRRMSGVRIRHAVTRGAMVQYIGDMSRREVAALAEYLASDQEALMPESAYCPSTPATTPVLSQWGFDANNSRWQRDTAINAGNVGSLRLKWAFAAPNVASMRSLPAITEDTIFLSTLAGRLFALDRQTGCIRWTYRAELPLRTAVTLGRAGGADGADGRAALFVGDQAAAIHAIDAETGALIWKQDVALFDASVTTGAPIQYGDTLFVPISAFGVALAMQPDYECCKSHGAVSALRVADGRVLWTTRMTAEAKPTYKNKLGVQMWGPSGAPVWTTPAIDAKRGLVYVGTGENTSSPATHLSDAIVALSMESGEIKWHFQGTKDDAFNMACGRQQASDSCPKENGPDFDFGASVIIAKTSEGKDILLAGQKSGDVYALDPDAKGKLLWQRRIGPGSALGGVHWGIAADAKQVYVPIADPFFAGITRKPGVWALNIDDGVDAWHQKADRDCTPTPRRDQATPWPDCPFRYEFSAAASIAADVVLAGALDGRAFAFHSQSGELLWEFATNRAFEAVNGVSGHGGAIDNAGLVAVDDLLIVLSGYDMFGQMPGNVLLVFQLPSADDVAAIQKQPAEGAP